MKETAVKLSIYFQEEITEEKAFDKLENILKDTPFQIYESEVRDVEGRKRFSEKMKKKNYEIIRKDEEMSKNMKEITFETAINGLEFKNIDFYPVYVGMNSGDYYRIYPIRKETKNIIDTDIFKSFEESIIVGYDIGGVFYTTKGLTEIQLYTKK